MSLFIVNHVINQLYYRVSENVFETDRLYANAKFRPSEYKKCRDNEAIKLQHLEPYVIFSVVAF